MGEIILTDANFEDEVLKSEIPVLVDFWASWCGPCQMLAPIIDELAKEYEGKLKVAKLNVDECQQKSIEYEISAIPTILIFKNGHAVKKLVGFTKKSRLINEINSVLGKNGVGGK
ncbi:MAG: thioredoxin [Elusimicrobiota bacterium]